METVRLELLGEHLANLVDLGVGAAAADEIARQRDAMVVGQAEDEAVGIGEAEGLLEVVEERVVRREERIVEHVAAVVLKEAHKRAVHQLAYLKQTERAVGRLFCCCCCYMLQNNL